MIEMKPGFKLKGRGANSNRDGRYNVTTHESVDDGWEYFENDTPSRTETAIEMARTIITRNQSPDIPFEQSVNPYRGWEHGT